MKKLEYLEMLEEPEERSQPLDPDSTIEWIPALRAFARSLTRNTIEADDLVQDTLLKAIQNQDKFRRGTNLRGWLFTIMRNTFYNSLVKSKRESPGAADCVSDQPWVKPTQEWSVRGNEVMSAVNRLPLHYREVFILVVTVSYTHLTLPTILRV